VGVARCDAIRLFYTEVEILDDSSQTPYYCKTDDDCPDGGTCKTWTWDIGAYCCDS